MKFSNIFPFPDEEQNRQFEPRDTCRDEKKQIREEGDNMRCLYSKVMMPRSVHCGDNGALQFGMSVQRGDIAVTA